MSTKDIIGKDKVIELPKWRKIFMLSVDTNGQQQPRVGNGMGSPPTVDVKQTTTFKMAPSIVRNSSCCLNGKKKGTRPGVCLHLYPRETLEGM